MSCNYPWQTKTVADFKIDYLQFINEQSELTQTLPAFANDNTLLKLYRDMALTRALDNKAINLQRTGKMGTYPSSRGQEAVGVGMGNALKQGDVFCPYYRDQAVFIGRGAGMLDILRYWGGDERGSDFSHPEAKEDFPVCVPIAGQLLHATGVAYAFKYRKQNRAALSIIGDGGTSKGDFYEALNLAGEWKLPVVFVINNNQWAISVPRKMQSHSETLAQKAIAAGIPSLQVDGNDVVAVKAAVDFALENARCDRGPFLIEALTYRLCDHTTADDASRYQPKDEVLEANKKEPVARLAYYLEAKGMWSRDKENELQTAVKQEVEDAVAQYLATTKANPTEMFEYLYAKLPSQLNDQMDELRKIG